MKILIFGSSITQGFWDSRGGWVGYLWENYINEYIQTKTKNYHAVFNLGISGNTSGDVVRRFDSEVKARHSQGDVAFVFSVGVNNTVREGNTFWSTPDEYAQDLADLLKKAKSYSDKVLFLGLTGCDEKRTLPVSWGNYWHSNERIALFDSVLKNFCQDNHLPYIELINLFKGKEDEFLSDGLHPNTKGHKLIYEKVKPELEKLLNS